MDISEDELAGLVDLFGALTRTELQSAVAEIAFKRDGDFEPESFSKDVDGAIHSYHLLDAPPSAVSGEPIDPGTDPTWLVSGPLAYPELPADAADLPHILEADKRSVDRSAVAEKAEERFRADAAGIVEAGDSISLADLRDVSYELETWGDLDLASVRTRLEAADE